jgi:hypothetical protein
MDPNGLMVVSTRDEARRLIAEWPRLTNRIVSFRQWNCCRGRRFRRIYIDDLDLMTPKQVQDMMLALSPMQPMFQAATVEGPSLALPAWT